MGGGSGRTGPEMNMRDGPESHVPSTSNQDKVRNSHVKKAHAREHLTPCPPAGSWQIEPEERNGGGSVHYVRSCPLRNVVQN